MSCLYSPYRAIGYVCDSNPFVINRLGEEIFITVSIGKCFQIFRMNKLVACLVSKTAPGAISGLQAIGHETFVNVDKSIVVYDRANIVRKYEVHTSPIVGSVSVGTMLLSFDQENNIKIHDTKERKLVTELTLLGTGRITAIAHPATYVNKFIVGFSDGQLELWNFKSKKLLYTFKSHLSVLSQHPGDEASSSAPAGAAPAVTCLEQSPACDVVAVGFSSGHIALLNLKLDQVLFSFQQKGGAVTSVSFRTDGGAEKSPFMASSSADGRIHIWNLGSNKAAEGESGAGQLKVRLDRKLQSTLEEAHVGAISRVEFVYGEPIMISAGAEDNSLKVWIFDAPDGSARLLRSREGHCGAPCRIRYYGGTTHVSMRDNADAMSCELVSAGTDGTLRLFNTAIEAQNRELSQKPLLKKLGLQRRNERLPQCVGFDFSETRQRDWGNLVTIHKDTAAAYVWKFRHRVATEMVLKQPHWQENSRKFVADRATHATAVALSPCGNFSVVGARGGALYKYNLQSGLPRGAFPRTAESDAARREIEKKAQIPGNIYHDTKAILSEQAVPLNKKEDDAATARKEPIAQVGHSGEVTGVFVDMLGVSMVTCSYDGTVCFWDFNTHELVERVVLPCPQVLMQGFRDAGFVAVAGQDRVIRVFDCATRKLSRRFAGGHSREITDLAFSPDGRRLLSAALDCTLRVWDLPSGRCLNWLQFSSPILSMAVSLSGEYLCLAQADKEGIYMYIDRSLYETVHFWREPVAPSPVADSLVLVSQEGEGAENEEGAKGGDTEGVLDRTEEEGGVTVVPPQAQVDAKEGAEREGAAQRGERAITMSAVPRAYWTSLFNLEAIKQRNRPVAAPAPPVQAPFFLPSVVRAGGSAPSFPTPAEYAKLTAELKTKQGSDASDGTGSKKRSGSVGEDGESSAKRARTEELEPSEEEAVLAELAGMGSAWSDGDGAEVAWTLDSNPSAAAASVSADVSAPAAKSSKRSSSRIISKKTQLPRCKLVAYLQAEDESQPAVGEDSPVLQYLSKLAPPAVDLELRALCAYEENQEGRQLLATLLRWLARNIGTGVSFEILQAYLHRALAIYLPLIVKFPELRAELDALQKAQAAASDRFRHLVQKNLCLLKVMGNLPIA